MKPNISDLVTFSSVARHQSFKKASIELGVSPSAVSHSIRQLEERLQLRLLNRTTRSVSLTEVGLRLFENIVPAIDCMNSAVDDIMPFREGPVGTLKITATRISARLYLTPLCTEFMAKYPGIKIHISSEDRLSNIIQDGLDAGVRFGHSISENMIATPISPKLRFVVAASPEYLSRHPPVHTPQDLVGRECIVYRFPTSGQPYLWEFEKDMQSIQADVKGMLTVDDMDIALEATLEGAGIGYFYERQVAPHINSGELVSLLDDWLPYRPGFYLYYPSARNQSFAFKTFLAFVKEKQRAGP